MRRLHLILLLLLVLCPVVGRAQEEKYTDQLGRKNAAGGVVIVYQDEEIEELVNGKFVPAAVRDSLARVAREEARKKEKTDGPHTKVNGFRVQIFMAGNTAKDKATIRNWARKFKTYFPDVNAYVTFNAPHWVCAAGDFRSREEANELLRQVRAIGQFKGACIVRSKVNSFY